MSDPTFNKLVIEFQLSLKNYFTKKNGNNFETAEV